MRTFILTIETKRNLYKILLSGLLMLGFAGISFGQKQGQILIDSLLAELPKAKEDTSKVNLLNAISQNYGYINTLQGIKYGREGLLLAETLKWQKGIAYSNYYLGFNYCVKQITITH